MRRTSRGIAAASSGLIPRRVAPDSCGCAMGAKFLGLGLVASIAWYGWHWHASDLSLWSMALRATLTSFAFAAVGKVVGMIAFKMRIRAG